MESRGSLTIAGVDVPTEVAAAIDVIDAFLAESNGPTGLGRQGLERGRRLQAADITRRRLEAATARLIAAAARDGDFLDDGHRDVRPWIGSWVNTSSSEARHEVRVAKLGAVHPVVVDHLAAGCLGVQQARALAATHANPRVADAFADALPHLLEIAEHDPYDLFYDRLRAWEQLTDADGSHRDHDHAHRGRHVHVATVGDTTYLDASFGNYQGAEITEILDRFTEAEFLAEWADGTLRHGPDMSTALLERTPAQRRADALVAIIRKAAATRPGAKEPDPVVNIVIPQAVFEEQLAAMLQDRPPVFATSDPARLWCATTTGIPVDPAVAVAAALIGHVRRVVVSSADVIIGFGTRERCFVGKSRQAAAVQFFVQTGGRCLWPACGRRHCQVDHTTPHFEGGRTDLNNAGPVCSRHNQIKNRGFHTWRDEAGRWHVTRPDGRDMEPI